VKMHNMGVVSEIGNAQSLADAILEVLDNREKYRGDPEAIKKTYDPESVVIEYEKLFAKLQGK
jgi:glycosyltransferase involved in cell wall biosynthesis